MTVQALLMDLPEQYRKLDPNLVESNWRPPDPSLWPKFSDAKRIGVDTEFRDAELTTLGVGCRRDPRTHYVFGISLAIEDGPKLYFPFRQAGGDNLDEAQVLAYFRHEFKNFKGELVGANLQCDLDWLWSMDMAMPQVRRFYDVQVADPLIYELEMSYSLDAISRRRGLGGKNEVGLRAAAARYNIDPKTDMWRLAGRHVGPYAEDDGALPLRILRKQEREMEEQGLMKVWDMESRLLPLLLRMTRKGVRVNMDRVDAMEKWAQTREADAWAIVKRETGVDIPVGQSMNVKLLSKALRAAGLEDLIGENTRGDSITKDKLFENSKHPVVAAIMDARKMAKVCSTYVNGTRKAIVHYGGGEYRIHTTFNQIRKTEDGKDGEDGKTKGVAYGRLSSSNPNMQNQPAADRQTGENLMGCMWRSVYGPEPGEIWCANDLKQQEPKWSFHYGAMLERATYPDGSKMFPDIKGAEDLCRRLRENPMLDTYEPLVEMTGKKRSVCKIMWLARAYGKGNGNMCEDLGYPTEDWVFVPRKMRSVPVSSEDGQKAIQMPGHVVFRGASPEGLKVIQDFDASMPFLKASAKLAELRAKDKGFVTLRSGRRCHFEKLATGEYEWCHKAFNRLIQGTSAEQMKEDMLAVDEAGYGDNLMLQVHDEVDASVPDEKTAAAIAEVMKYAVPMEVPTVVDTECGPSWGESMSVEEVVDGKKVKRPYRWHLT